jgi:hypothetical protein
MPIVDGVFYDVWDEVHEAAGTIHVKPLDTALRDALGDDISGISVGGGIVTVHYLELGQEATGAAIIAGHGALSPATTTDIINANGIDESVVTVPSLSVFDYRIWLDGEVVLAGSIADGSLAFSTDTRGVYLIEIIDGDDTGYVTVVAV